jgi:hypothetical protein
MGNKYFLGGRIERKPGKANFSSHHFKENFL